MSNYQYSINKIETQQGEQVNILAAENADVLKMYITQCVAKAHKQCAALTEVSFLCKFDNIENCSSVLMECKHEK